ncbi:hypothetical protein HHL19_31570 [Streptomyces sp. R302]|uniref:hypothetical protein n=1 Tax=unclassified Streptomyces TaxID=2593676 RepID=UPI00145F7B83|nr:MULTISPECIES: hypothetical protein [unclassified Streptomyces]NML53818.1 hypothetical protein [Streptomyces sp. R301]NML83077.1 hypothetical protein [Streptomyces sp. R302]
MKKQLGRRATVASTVWTVSPSGGFTAVSGNVVLGVNGLALPCGRSTASGRPQNATGDPAPVAVIDPLADLKATVGTCALRAAAKASSASTDATGAFAADGLAGELTVVAAAGCRTFVPVGSRPAFKGTRLVTITGTTP